MQDSTSTLPSAGTSVVVGDGVVPGISSVSPSSVINGPAVSCMSISNSFFEQAAHQNADGVVSLQQGDCGRAFHSFVATLTTLSHFRHYHTLHSSSSSSLDPPTQCAPTPAPKPKNCKAIPVPYLEDSGFYIYNHAVIFSRRPRIGGDGTGNRNGNDNDKCASQLLDTISWMEAVTQFNLGLAYHQRGKHCGEDRTLQGALQLYEQAQATLRGISSTNCEETKILQLAVMNNRIHILNELARYQEAQELVNDLLLQAVAALQFDVLSFLTKTDIDHFLLNALVIRRFNTAPCA
ncbi:expressed unknown protein [Seminavis robusta]|uniref:Uncharacterized protein n=1 Tax=Seminavis robusta TaxID=568900 RepID=A0A9N8E6V0_9STRA|nr:expressed unknown protein [Seminavis robusta]|eukprot:Sro713_g191620.1 n/a (293) ;mRNA; r:37113-37991